MIIFPDDVTVRGAIITRVVNVVSRAKKKTLVPPELGLVKVNVEPRSFSLPSDPRV